MRMIVEADGTVSKAFATHEEAEADMRAEERAMLPLERTQILEEMRRAIWPEAYRNPPTILEPAVLVPSKVCGIPRRWSLVRRFPRLSPKHKGSGPAD